MKIDSIKMTKEMDINYRNSTWVVTIPKSIMEDRIPHLDKMFTNWYSRHSDIPNPFNTEQTSKQDYPQLKGKKKFATRIDEIEKRIIHFGAIGGEEMLNLNDSFIALSPYKEEIVLALSNSSRRMTL